MKLLSIFLYFLLISFSKYSYSDVLNTKYDLNITILGVNIKIGEINSQLVIKDSIYNLSYDLSSENLVSIFTPIDGNGEVSGNIIKSKLVPNHYIYTYKKKDKIKTTNIKFNNSNVSFVNVNPPFQKSKLTAVNDEMLKNVVDPTTAIIIIGDYKLNNECTVDYRIYDGKRRYDLQYQEKYIEDNNIVCSLVRYKIGGFKLKDDEVNPFKPAQRIDTYFELINDEYILKKIITKSRFSEISIDVSRY